MKVASTGAEGKVIGGGVQGGLLEPCRRRPLPGLQLDLVAADVVIVDVCAVKRVSTGTRREVPWQFLHTCNDSLLDRTAMHYHRLLPSHIAMHMYLMLLDTCLELASVSFSETICQALQIFWALHC